MGLWPVSMLVAAELLRVLRVLRLSSSTVVAWAQALVVLALVIQSSHYTWPCRTQGQFSASLRVLHQIEPTRGQPLRQPFGAKLPLPAFVAERLLGGPAAIRATQA